MRTVIPALEAAELKQLYRQVPRLVWAVSNSVRLDEADRTIADDVLDRLRQRHDELASVLSRIRQIVEA